MVNAEKIHEMYIKELLILVQIIQEDEKNFAGIIVGKSRKKRREKEKIIKARELQRSSDTIGRLKDYMRAKGKI